ncbi:hypothetical protein LCGC14_2894420 [marine sediment metagenome]|uniref:Uncharacterized protein n=1 Tax=marine sediment metagenome TaxID=412755 RepID=A0A0F8XWC3_9ZZZZ
MERKVDDLSIIIKALRNTYYNKVADEIERLIKIRDEREAKITAEAYEEALRSTKDW